MNKISINDLSDSNFNGQKILHPFKMKTIKETYSFKNKRGKTITKNTQGKVYENEFIDKETKNEIENAIRFEVKHDGSCGYIQYNPEDDSYTPYTRRDIKKDKTGDFPEPSSEWIPCEPKPTSKEATHWPHFRKCNEDTSQYKWELEAFETAMKTGKLNIKKSLTCEYMGKKKNFCSSDPIESNCVIVPHGLYHIEIPKDSRTYEGLLKVLQDISYIEGIIIYGPTKIFKIRRDMFFIDGSRLKWPNPDSVKKLSEEVMLG